MEFLQALLHTIHQATITPSISEDVLELNVIDVGAVIVIVLF